MTTQSKLATHTHKHTLLSPYPSLFSFTDLSYAWHCIISSSV